MVKKLTFCKLSYLRKCKRRGVGGQKKPNFVNIVCERPLTLAAHYVSVLLSCSKNGTMGLRGVQPGKFSYCDSSRPQAYLSGGD